METEDEEYDDENEHEEYDEMDEKELAEIMGGPHQHNPHENNRNLNVNDNLQHENEDPVENNDFNAYLAMMLYYLVNGVLKVDLR